MKLIKICSLLAALYGLTSCDIQPVSVGEWNITTVGLGGLSAAPQSVWTITDTPALTMEGSPSLVAEEIALRGSRISWSSMMADPANPDSRSRVNFNGTVDGNRLAGTLFTQFGNFTVNGIRQ